MGQLLQEFLSFRCHFRVSVLAVPLLSSERLALSAMWEISPRRLVAKEMH